MTDLEGVAGVRDFEEWTGPGCRYYDIARELLTLEVNAAVDGFFAAGATEILVADGHGPGAVDIMKLDPRADLARGWAPGHAFPFGLDASFAARATIGQHAMSRTPYSNMAHTGSCGCLEYSVNGIAIGEFGQMTLCASELGVPTIYATGEQAFCEEAEALVPGIETASVKRGTIPGRGDDCTTEQYRARNKGAVHMHPERARKLIRDGAARALERLKNGEKFGLVPLTPPFRRVRILRGKDENPQRTYDIDEHPSSVIELLNMPGTWKPVESDEQLKELLVD